MQTVKQAVRLGAANPAMIAGAVLLAAAAAFGAWYYLGRDSNPLGDNVSVTVNGKEIDPKTVRKGGTIELPGGGSFTMANAPAGPGGMMGETMKAYFDLPAGPARNKYLDDMIDKQEAIKKEMNITQSADGPEVKLKAETAGAAPGTQPSQKIVIRSNGAGGDSMPPELRAQLAEFAAAMSKRRAERGLPPQQGMMMFRTSKTP